MLLRSDKGNDFAYFGVVVDIYEQVIIPNRHRFYSRGKTLQLR